MPFQIHALSETWFSDYFQFDKAQLAASDAHLEIVTEKPGTPCRVSLADAEVGETVLLVNYEHQPEDTPYKASHAIFVREHAVQATLDVNEIPHALASRLLSVRGFDGAHFMRTADVVEGSGLGETIETMFAEAEIAYIHVHNARPGCFAAKVTRA